MLTPAELVWLIAAVAKGDEAAFERLYAATRAKLFGVVLRILRRQDLAEEVIQEAYVKIWNSAGQFNPGLSSPITWMASIARNRAIDVVRKRSEVSIEEEPAAMEVAADSPGSAGAPRDDGRVEAIAGVRRPSGAGSAKTRAAGLLQRLEPRAVGGQIRDAGEYGEDMAAPQHDGHPGVPWTGIMAYSEDHIALAAEYALGTLDADERAQVETMMAGRQGLHGDGSGVGAKARCAEPDGRIGRAAARGLGEDQRPRQDCPSRRSRWCFPRRRRRRRRRRRTSASLPRPWTIPT